MATKNSEVSNPNDLKRTNMYISAGQRQILDRLASQTGLSMAEHVRRAVAKYIRRKEFTEILTEAPANAE